MPLAEPERSGPHHRDHPDPSSAPAPGHHPGSRPGPSDQSRGDTRTVPGATPESSRPGPADRAGSLPGAGPAGPLAGRRVVVCRPDEVAGPLLDRIRSLGADAIAAPLSAPAPAADGGAALRAAVAVISTYDWIAVTSANGVQALAAALTATAVIGDPPTVPPLAAVGRATAAAATAAGLTVGYVPERATAADLAADLPVAGPGRRILAPLAEAAGDDLQRGLEAAGCVVDRVDAYRMVPVPAERSLIATVAAADVVVVTAPSIVDALIDLTGPGVFSPVGPQLLCIGPRTADRASVRGVERPIVAPVHDAGGLVEALLTLFPPPGTHQAGAGAAPTPAPREDRS